ncbi:LysR family transcriptional regulator [Dyadobacter sp. NIV53]|uniref:LysR family transcriptional regulator n=1 Tax=Dyadobacter sp. NIV53 TaxID=2861765 RepID=UPI001C86771A|nr:LysR family transcriptional regulator [Dyadobacter sp. NIV53]
MLDFRLKVFYTVAQTLNFNRAAEQLNISQPAVTKHIKELEQLYVTTLFDRTRKHIVLTKSGEVLLQHAHLIFEQYQKLEFDLNLLPEQNGRDIAHWCQYYHCSVCYSRLSGSFSPAFSGY